MRLPIITQLQSVSSRQTRPGLSAVPFFSLLWGSDLISRTARSVPLSTAPTGASALQLQESASNGLPSFHAVECRLEQLDISRISQLVTSVLNPFPFKSILG